MTTTDELRTALPTWRNTLAEMRLQVNNIAHQHKQEDGFADIFAGMFCSVIVEITCLMATIKAAMDNIEGQE